MKNNLNSKKNKKGISDSHNEKADETHSLMRNAYVKGKLTKAEWASWLEVRAFARKYGSNGEGLVDA